jgi:branched-chain amino acid transport system substrate-binding protein
VYRSAGKRLEQEAPDSETANAVQGFGVCSETKSSSGDFFMKRSILFLLIVLLAVGAGTVTVAQDAAPDSISIGAVIPLTGRYAGGGAQVQRGYQLAVDDINAAGGVHVDEYNADLPLKLTILDDESDPTKTVSNLEDLNSQGVVAYLGGFGSDLHAAAAAIAEKNAIPYLGVAFALWDIHEQGYKYLFSPFPKSPDLASTTFDLLNSIPEDQRPKNIGILQEQTDWGIELGTLWKDDAAKSGYTVAAYEEYAPGTKDFTDAILALQNANVDAVLALPNPPDGITLVNQMAELNFVPKFSLIIRAPDNPAWADSLGPVGDFVTFAPGWHHAMKFPGVDKLNEEHMALVGRPADPIVGPSYALIQILAAAIEKAGKLDRDAIRDAIAASDVDTVIGHITFRDDGTAPVTTAILQYQHGKQELVWPAEFATAPLAYPALPYDERPTPEPKPTPEPTATP